MRRTGTVTTNTNRTRSRAIDRRRFSIVSLIPTVYAPSFLLAVGQGVLIPVLPIFAKDELLATDVMIGLAVGAKHIGTLAFDVPAGILVSRFGMWRTMLVGILLFAVAAVAAANSPNFGTLFIARFAAGASFAFWMISRHAFIAGAVPTRHRGKALSLYGGTSRVAAIIGPVLGGVLAEYVDIRSPFYVQAAIALLTGLMVLYTMRKTGGDTVDPKGHRNVFTSIGSTMVAHRHDFLTAGLVAVILQFVRAAREFLIPVWGDEMGLKTDQIGYVASASYAVDSTMFPIVGWTMDRFGRKYVGVPALLIMGLGLSLLPFADGMTMLMIAGVLAGLGNGLSSGFVLTLGSDLAPLDDPGEFLGVWRFISDTGGAIGPPLIGGIAQVMALGTATWFTGGVAGFGALALVVLVKETVARKRLLRRRR